MKVHTLLGGLIEVAPLGEHAGNLLALPALIDPHVHFRTPGATQKEDWITGARAAISGGVTTVLDMPNTEPLTIDQQTFNQKKELIESQLQEIGIPLRYKLYLGATAENSDEFFGLQGEIAGVKLYMGSSTGDLLVADADAQEKVFLAAASAALVVAVHAEDEQEIQKQRANIANPTLEDHARIRHRGVAATAMKRAIAAAEKTRTKVYFCHISTAEEVELIAAAKKQGIKVFAEVTPHHLFLDESHLESLGTLGQMNPPLRMPADQLALWQGVADGVIDTIGSDHAPHTLEEKAVAYPKSPSGVPGIETTLPLLLTAAKQGRIALEKIVELTRTNAQKIFGLPDNDDWVIVDLDKKKTVENSMLKTKCGWSPFLGWMLTGWPVGVQVQGKQFIFQ